MEDREDHCARRRIKSGCQANALARQDKSDHEETEGNYSFEVALSIAAVAGWCCRAPDTKTRRR